MKRIAFVCLGNICRSPMAEFVFCEKVKALGRAGEFEVASFATSDEEDGNPVYPPVFRLLTALGIDCSRKRATPLSSRDGGNFDLFVCMDESNLRNARRILGRENADKCVKLKSYLGSSADVADPWYTRDFEGCYREISEALDAMIATL